MKKKIIKTRDKIARELWASNQFKQKVIPNKKKIVKKFDYKKEISYYPNAYLLSFQIIADIRSEELVFVQKEG